MLPGHPGGYGYHHGLTPLFAYPHHPLNFGFHAPYFGHPFTPAAVGGHYGGGHHGSGYGEIPKQACSYSFVC